MVGREIRSSALERAITYQVQAPGRVLDGNRGVQACSALKANVDVQVASARARVFLERWFRGKDHDDVEGL